MSESVFPPKDCNSLVVPAMPVWNYEDLILPEVPEAPFVQSTLLDNPAPFPRRQSVNQPDRGGIWIEILDSPGSSGFYTSWRQVVPHYIGESVTWSPKPGGAAGPEDGSLYEVNEFDHVPANSVVLAVPYDGPVDEEDPIPAAYLFQWSEEPAYGFGKPTAPYSGGETIELDPCDASGESLGLAAITVQADWTLATGCQIETDQIIPVTKVDDEYYAVGMPKTVVTDMRLYLDGGEKKVKFQKKVRLDFGAFHSSESDWVDAGYIMYVGPFNCPTA